MKIEGLKLINYRNYNNLDIKFNDNFNIFYGQNGSGKTNIIESLFFQSFLFSYRVSNLSNLITEKESFFSIETFFEYDQNIRHSNKSIYSNDLELFIDGEVVKKKKNFKTFDILLFYPEELMIIKGSPQDRRKYLDDQLSQFSDNYYKTLILYRKILKQRNFLLKQKRDNQKVDDILLKIINQKFIEYSSFITLYRNNYIDSINKRINKIYNELIDIKNLKLSYQTGLNSINNDIYQIKEEYTKIYEENKDKEMELGMSIIGPHRDDYVFLFNNKDIREIGSQGQQRMAIIALKFSELDIYIKNKKNKPILLLDDIFSELDDQKKIKIMKYLNKDIQVFITLTEVESFIKNIKSNFTLFKVENNNIKEEVLNGK